jgi:putative transposase
MVFARSSYHYRSRKDDRALTARIHEIAATRVRYSSVKDGVLIISGYIAYIARKV